jgi:hypothetical protein
MAVGGAVIEAATAVTVIGASAIATRSWSRK